MENLLQQVSNYGFPMVISIYLLVRVESKLEALALSINGLTRVIETVKEVQPHG
ncbi:MAG: YvrJ family protein [Peptococcaceae bacterium]